MLIDLNIRGAGLHILRVDFHVREAGFHIREAGLHIRGWSSFRVSYSLSIERACFCVWKSGLRFLAADFVSGEQVCVFGELVSVSDEPISASGELMSVSGSNTPFLE